MNRCARPGHAYVISTTSGVSVVDGRVYPAFDSGSRKPRTMSASAGAFFRLAA